MVYDSVGSFTLLCDSYIDIDNAYYLYIYQYFCANMWVAQKSI